MLNSIIFCIVGVILLLVGLRIIRASFVLYEKQGMLVTNENISLCGCFLLVIGLSLLFISMGTILLMK
jgi:uncharacterized membrane protein